MDNIDLPDRVADMFHGRTIFISGGTGFVGKALIEMILRVTTVKKIYILIRNKKGKCPSERIQDIFNNVLFKTLIEQNPDITKKCTCIAGDVIQEDLGITKDDRELLKREVDFIFHCAATTRFDDTVKYAVTMNTRGTKYMLELAEECKNLKLFVHVSTAYAFPHEEITYEKQYSPPANPHEVLNSINWLQEDQMSNMMKKLPGDMPNSYTFSKSLAEALVYEKVGKVPLIICRPAVVIPSIRDPYPGWFNNLQGPMGIFVAAGKGVIRSIYMDNKSYANLIPVDCTVSAILVTSWYYLTATSPPYIFNLCVPHSDFRTNWQEIVQDGIEVINERVPFNGILWYPSGTMTTSRIYNKINIFLFQLIPAICIDLLLIILQYKPILYSIQMRILKGNEMFEFYTVKAWNFDTTNVENCRIKLNNKEKQIYLLQADRIDIKDFLTDAILSCRRHILKETDEMLPAARRNMKIMYVIDRLVKILFFGILGYYFCKWFLDPFLNNFISLL